MACYAIDFAIFSRTLTVCICVTFTYDNRKCGMDIFTARCTLVQSAVLQSHVVCLSVCLSVSLSVSNGGEL